MEGQRGLKFMIGNSSSDDVGVRGGEYDEADELDDVGELAPG